MSTFSKSRVKAGLLLGIATFALASCGGGADSSSTASDGSSTDFVYQNYDIGLYGNPEDLNTTITIWVTSSGTNLQWIGVLAREFNKFYPNIKIEGTTSGQGDYDGIKDKIDRTIAAGGSGLPNLAYCYPDHVSDYIEAEAVIPMDGFVKDPVIGLEGSYSEEGITYLGVDDFVKSYWNEGLAYQTEGLYSLPWTKSTELLFYNRDLFQEFGLTEPNGNMTWEDMWDLCQQVQDACAGVVNNWHAPLGYDSDSNLFITMCKQMGIPYTDNTQEMPLLWNNDQAKSMVRELKGYYDKGLLRTKLTSGNNTYTSSFFEEGRAAMMISSSGGTSYADTPNFEVGVCAAPHIEGQDPAYVSQGPSLCFFGNGSWEQRYASWLFYRFCTSSENSAYIATQSTGYDPVRISSYETDYYKTWLQDQGDRLYGRASKVTASIRDDTFYTDVFPGSAVCRDEVGNILGNVFLDTMSIDDAFQYSFNQSVNAL